jgi:starch synthase
VPVVRATGGLDDTVEAFDPVTGSGTGFKFHDYTRDALLATLRQALTVYADRRIWRRLQRAGMAKDFSWDGPAAAYVREYREAMRQRTLH